MIEISRYILAVIVAQTVSGGLSGIDFGSVTRASSHRTVYLSMRIT
jgi:hypothetical protein